MCACADAPEPCLLVTYKGLAGNGVALVAYSDGTVLFEDGSDSSLGGHRQERFRNLDEAAETLGLPLQLHLQQGNVCLKMDSSCCCPTYQVWRLMPPVNPQGGSETGASGAADVPGVPGRVTVTHVRYTFGNDDPVRAANEFRAFRSKIAAHERRTSRGTRSLAARLNLGEEAFACAVAAEGVDTVEDRLKLLGLCHRNGDDSDEEWPLEVRRATEEIQARLRGGPLTVSILREVLNRRPPGAVLPETADLTGWEPILEASSSGPAPHFPLLRVWLTSRIARSTVVRC